MAAVRIDQPDGTDGRADDHANTLDANEARDANAAACSAVVRHDSVSFRLATFITVSDNHMPGV